MLDFATQDRDGTLRQALETWHKKAEGSSCNYGFHMAIARWDAETEKEMDYMSDNGVTSYKMYMVYDGLKVDDGRYMPPSRPPRSRRPHRHTLRELGSAASAA